MRGNHDRHRYMRSSFPVLERDLNLVELAKDKSWSQAKVSQSCLGFPTFLSWKGKNEGNLYPHRGFSDGADPEISSRPVTLGALPFKKLENSQFFDFHSSRFPI